MKRPSNAPGSIARGGAITLCLVAVLSGTLARSEAPRSAPQSALVLAGPFAPAASGDRVAAALAAAQEAYAGGDLRAARAWIGVANRHLDAVLARQGSLERWSTGNASQLLEYLHLYGLFVYGAKPDLDLQYERLSSDLARVDALNGAPVHPARAGNESVSYDLISHLVRRIGDLQIDYDLITQQITRLGDLRVSYDLITHQPTRIGDIEYGYDLIDRSVRSVAGVDTDRRAARCKRWRQGRVADGRSGMGLRPVPAVCQAHPFQLAPVP
jgi:hypothetical protein